MLALPIAIGALALLSQAPPPAPERPALTVGFTWDASAFNFRFDNPSRFNTEALVPHYFEQRYRRPHPAVTLEARYGLAGHLAMTTIRVGARRIIHASDIDTFEQPGGDVATSGTDGPVRLRAWAVRQGIPLGRAREWSFLGTAAYTRDTADFQPDFRVVTHSQPPSVTREFITDQEFTTSETLRIGVSAERRVGQGRWRQTWSVEVEPVVSARLLVQLPQKYPGVDLRFAALGSGASVGWMVTRRLGGVFWGLRADGEVTWRYRQTAAYRSHALRVTGFVGR
jgi:hypothetical protein